MSKAGQLKPLVVVGAGGFGREVASLIHDVNAIRSEWQFLGFLDDGVNGSTVEGYPILGQIDSISTLARPIYAVCAVGDPRLRRKLVSHIQTYDCKFATLIHPTVSKSQYVSIGEGSIICAGTILTTNIKIGKHSILNLNCKVGHDSILGNYTSCMPGVNIAGEVVVGDGSYFGLNACVINRVNIGEWSIIGAGASAVKDIPSRCVAVGVPAKPIRTLDD
ncbi:MAG: acetyltransferase [Firmicutes bacterium]|jgi:sugar O-acyltransferase (sialic acid O-acetyltransferase NeuD family)|nr:acetyltransferase [Bacillota bacterium]